MVYIKMFIDYLDAIEPLADDERGRLFTALLYYARYGEVPELKGNEKFLFPMMKAQIDRDQAAGQEISAKRSLAARSKSKQVQASVANDNNSRQEKDKDKDKEEDKDNNKDKDNKFDRWWAVYPKKVGKEAARRSFAKVKVDVDVLIKAVEEQKQSVQWKKYNGRYIPNPATWLNQGRWEDEIEKDTQESVSMNYGITDLERLRKLSERLGKDA